MSDFVPPFELPPETPPAPERTPEEIRELAEKRKVSRSSADQLGIVWLRGSLHIGLLRQRKMPGWWKSPQPVRTIEEFSAALDTALVELQFAGTETFLVFEGDQFVHQTEAAPAFSNAATRAYLQSRVERYAKEHGPVLWVAQPTVAVREEKAFILHLLPRSFYGQLNQVLLARGLDLTRILPMAVPAQREMNTFPIPKGEPALIAVEAGDATIVVVARAGGPVLFSRTILASLEADPARIAVEINRSLLYAKQQFNTNVDRIWLATRTGKAQPDVQARCGAGKMTMVLPTQPEEWLQSVTRVNPNQPINLLAGYLARKRRQQLLHRGAIVACWLGLAWMLLGAWADRQDWAVERTRLGRLAAAEATLAAERDRLAQRNATVAQEAELAARVLDERLPAVPGRFLAYLAGALPNDVRLTRFHVRWDAAAQVWAFECDGLVAADEETARETVAALQRHLAGGPLRIRLHETAPIAGGGAAAAGDQQRFTLGGTLFEN